MVRQLMHETVGDFYFPGQDQSSMKRATAVLQRHSADFWSEFNRAAGRPGPAACSALSTGAWSRQKHNETPGRGTGNGRR